MAATFCAVDVATAELADGGICFGLALRHLHADRVIDAEAVARDGAALITALEGQRDARFVLQTSSFPDVRHPERGHLDIHLLVAFGPDGAPTPERIDELCDDLLDLLAAPPVRWSFEPIADPGELVGVLHPFTPTAFAEVARREEPCLPTSWVGGVGFGTDPADRRAERSLWSMWTLGPPSPDLRRLGAVLLAQEAPVCIRVTLAPSGLTAEERAAIEELSRGVGGGLPGMQAASMHTLESLLYLRPLFDVRCVVASPAPLSRSLLSALGHATSEPPDHGASTPVLQGGFAVIRGEADVEAAILHRAYDALSTGDPIPSLAPPGLERARRLLGPREAANVFRIPVTDHDGFPGIETLRVPDLVVPLADLSNEGDEAGHVVGDPRHKVLLDREERFRHLYVSGQTGTGKSTLLLNLALQDIEAGTGVAVIDPHGDLVDALLGRIPEDRIDDVVLIDPSDPVAVAGVNLLEAETATQRGYVVSELAAMFYALFDPKRLGFIGPRYETWLRQAAQLLLANPDRPSSLLDIPTIFVDPAVRRELLKGIEDPILAEFWFGEMAQTSDYHKSEVLGWFRSKFEIFRTSPLVRNVIGQARSTVSFSDVMNEQKILLVNLSKGLLGEYNSALIGHIVFSRLWSTAIDRASIPPKDRKDFAIYIDEFQNMTTESLPTVLSEARKFRVSLTLANQFFSQVPEMTRDAIMGNVGSRITFRLGPKDAAPFASWLGSDVQEHDLTRLPNHLAVGALSTDGIPLDPFPFKTEPPRGEWSEARARTVVERSRAQWAVPTDTLDASFFARWADVPGSAAAKLATPGAADGPSPSLPGDSIAEPTFIEQWVLDRILDEQGAERVDARFARRPDGAFVRCATLLVRRFHMDVDEAVQVAGAMDGAEICDLQLSHARALRYELRLLGAELIIEPDPGPQGTDRSIADLDLPTAVRARLASAGYATTADLAAASREELLAIDGIGPKAIDRIDAALAAQGLLATQPPPPDPGVDIDVAWLVAAGFGGIGDDALESLAGRATREIERRVGAVVASRLSDEQLTLVDAAQAVERGLGVAAIEELVPDRAQLVADHTGAVAQELLAQRAAILRELALPS